MAMAAEKENSQEKIVVCPSYLPTLKDGLHRIKENFCDATLLAGGKIFPVHKVILAANSKYFYSIFVQNFNERDSDEIRMPPEIEAEAMKALVNYFYSGELALSPANVEPLFKATDYMRLDSLLEICIEYLHETLDPTNCIRRFIMTKPIPYFSPRFDSFKRAASDLIVEEALKVSETADFLSLSEDLFSDILKYNKQPEKAESLYTAIVQWVIHDEESRRGVLCDLLKTLPVEGISNEFFTSRMENEELLRRDPNSVLWLLDNATQRLLSISPPQSHPNSLLVTEREITQKCFIVKMQNPAPLAIHDRPEIFNFSVVSHRKQIYLLCGEETEKSYRLEDPQGSWVDCDLNLKFRRNNAGCVVLGDDLFVIGGWDWTSKSNLKSCMKFNFTSERKYDLSAMKMSRHLPGVAVYANAVYAACGFSASGWIERYDPREGQWFAIGRYETEIDFCSSAAVANYLYSCDANSGIIERFDFRANWSQDICSLPSTSGREKWITSVGRDLYGTNGGSVLAYDGIADEWNNLSTGIGLEYPVIVPWS